MNKRTTETTINDGLCGWDGSLEQLCRHFSVDISPLQDVAKIYPARISPYYRQLIQAPGDPIWHQAVPDLQELSDPEGIEDPLDEENLSPVPNLVHKYPDRALFLISSQCPVYCRFCTRKRKVGRSEMQITEETIAAGLDYLQKTPAIKDVLLSGGDPFMLADQQLENILSRLRRIPSVETIRIGTRVPCTLPARVTPELAAMLARFHPLYINTHFNHPRELTAEAKRACTLLADAGIPLGCQTVLLRGVNDSVTTLRELFRGLLAMRVKPYYLFQIDQTKGTSHFRTTIETGLALMAGLIGHISGMAIPTYALDAPGGGGKIPLTPAYITGCGQTLEFTTYKGLACSYPNRHWNGT
ncbi:KamA family radical SAM protein [Desulfobulbus rhabdoformis]|uniref:KamA family radical SAM protein n=1 Tax=Desulfobulbus rhabdoformis TaxID=34032 RepID=UPI001962FD42|nr:KamA family radical SAM protein [Desulfobulbus rhabdoformis]MBM9612724.1 KamA family radical SAM protein [Desulfobulbus rhabdoformis]